MIAGYFVAAVSILATIAVFLQVFVGSAGPDPVKQTLHSLGVLSVLALIATLSVSTISRLGSWPLVMRWRRPLGLATFYFASLHTAFYVLYQGASVKFIAEDVTERPFVFYGFAAWLMLIPLAMTSSRFARRRLGPTWTRIHQMIYVIAVLAVIHQLMAQKTVFQMQLIYSIVLALLLAERCWRNWSKLDRFLGR
jgi:sulfoxide reductase heme-binding subunit YedZ